jgi:myo-inositol 2-dehydrogenase/D-chiro-inositol 1-dehydrogenase
MSSLRLGIIGAGSIVARKHLLAVAEVPEIAVVALCRRDAAALQTLADRFRIPGRHTDYRELLRDPGIDAVLVATGVAAQPDIVMDAVAAGKHVFAEKPMAASVAEARRMADTIARGPVHFQLGFNKRFYHGYRTVRQLIREGQLGTPMGIQARFWFQPGRADPMLQNGIHFFDLARFFMGPVDTVFARKADPGPGPAAEHAETWAVTLQFRSGAVGNLLLSSQASWDYVNEHVDLVGSNRAAVSVDNGRLTRVFRSSDGHRAELHESTLSAHWWSGNDEQGFTAQLRVFARAVLARCGAAVEPDALGSMAAGAEDGVRALEVLDAVRESATRGQSIAVPVGDTTPPASTIPRPATRKPAQAQEVSP